MSSRRRILVIISEILFLPSYLTSVQMWSQSDKFQPIYSNLCKWDIGITMGNVENSGRNFEKNAVKLFL